MYLVIRLTLLFACLLVCFSSTACSEAEECVPHNSWQLGLAVGLGIKTNPLVGGDDIPLVLLPDIAWYGENAYFDNAELGYQWINDSMVSVETFVQVDNEAAFFSFLHPVNILISGDTGTSLDINEPDADDAPMPPDDSEVENPNKFLSIDNIANRNWAINGGIRLHYFVANSEFTLAGLTDVSGVHKGQQVEFAYQYKWQWHTTRFNAKLGASWKSAALIDYYYGVSEQDTQHSELFFSGQAGWQPHMNISVQHPINNHWMWIANAGYSKLPDSLYRSPLIQNNHVERIFLGVAYRY